MKTLASICFVLMYFNMAVYFLEMVLLSLFPTYEVCDDIPYTGKENIHFFLVIPCLNEGSCIKSTLDSLLKLNFPNTTIVAINDDSDDDTLEQMISFGNAFVIENDKEDLSAYDNERLIVLNRHKPNAQKGKGAALNSAYSIIGRIIKAKVLDSNKCIMSIFDADVFVTRSMLERVAVIMANEPKTGMVQARVRIGISTRDYFLPRMQDIEFFMYINRQQNLREYMGTVAAAGNGQFNRYSAIDPKCPWTSCLLEDFDFSMRLLLKGWRTRLLQSERVYQQGVLDYKSFVKQRTRWCQGGMQCFHFYKEIWKSEKLSLFGKLELTSFLSISVLTTLSIVTMLLSIFICSYYAVCQENLMAVLLAPFPTYELYIVFGAVMAFAFLPGLVYGIWYYRDTKENLACCILGGLFEPIYNLMQAPCVIIAGWRQLIGNSGWVKTKHKE